MAAGGWRSPPRCRRCSPRWTRCHRRAAVGVAGQSRRPGCCSARCPPAFHAGVQDILLIAFGLACAEFFGTRRRADRHRRRGPRPQRGTGLPGSTCRAPSGGSPPSTRWHWPSASCRWAQVVAGEAALGAVVKDAKEQLRALPGRLTYGLLRYLNADVDLPGSDPPIGFNYLGRLGAHRADPTTAGGSAAGLAVQPTPQRRSADAADAHRRAQRRHRRHRRRPAAARRLDVGAVGRSIDAQVDRLGRLWFDALAGICAHVRRGGGGLTPSDIAPARLSQQQIDELQRQHRIADVLPLTPLQQGLLFHASTARGSAATCTRCSWIHPHRPARPRPAARGGAGGGRPASQPGWPASATSSTSRCRSSRPIRWRPWRYVDARRRRPATSMSRSDGCAPPSGPLSATSPTSRRSGSR